MNEATEFILKIAAILSACGVIAKTVHSFYKTIKAIYDDLKDIKTRIEKTEEYERENYMSTLRLTIMSEEMPLDERIAAGDKYIANGGNGSVRHKYEQLIKQLDKEDK